MPDGKPKSIGGINTAHQLALGVAFGMLIGLIPKESALAWGIGLLFLLSRANLLCGIIVGFVVTLLSPLLDVYSARIGFSILSIESLQTTYSTWLELPFVAWTRFNNTVVIGSLAIGLLAWFPVYLLGQVFFRSVGIAMIRRVMQIPVVRFVFGDPEPEAEPVADENPFAVES